LIARTGRVTVLFVAAALILTSAATASTSDNPNCGSACDEYSESTPSATGSHPVKKATTTSSKSKKKKTTTSPKVERVIQQATPKGRKKLKRIVTTPDTAAPTERLRKVKTPTNTSVTSSLGKSLGASIASPGSGSVGRLIGLLVAIVVTTASVGAVAANKQRR
jgi:hypothetical protein